ncbi:hypothetical protein MTsN3n11_00020 [Qipengyuania sp. MTN3-11]
MWFVGLLTLALCLLGYLLYVVDSSNVKLLGLLGGVASGIIVYLVTFLSVLAPLQRVDHFDRLGVIDLLENRHDKEYYREIVKNCRERVDVMGASCTRFVEDFLDLESENKVLVEALDRHKRLAIRFLIPTDEFMSKSTQNRITDLMPKFNELKKKYADRVQLGRFEGEAAHSFVLVDEHLIAGPIFAREKSKYAPAVHVAASTPFARKYAEHFQDVWDAAPIKV